MGPPHWALFSRVRKEKKNLQTTESLLLYLFSFLLFSWKALPRQVTGPIGGRGHTQEKVPLFYSVNRSLRSPLVTLTNVAAHIWIECAIIFRAPRKMRPLDRYFTINTQQLWWNVYPKWGETQAKASSLLMRTESLWITSYVRKYMPNAWIAPLIVLEPILRFIWKIKNRSTFTREKVEVWKVNLYISASYTSHCKQQQQAAPDQ